MRGGKRVRKVSVGAAALRGCLILLSRTGGRREIFPAVKAVRARSVAASVGLMPWEGPRVLRKESGRILKDLSVRKGETRGSSFLRSRGRDDPVRIILCVGTLSASKIACTVSRLVIGEERSAAGPLRVGLSTEIFWVRSE